MIETIQRYKRETGTDVTRTLNSIDELNCSEELREFIQWLIERQFEVFVPELQDLSELLQLIDNHGSADLQQLIPKLMEYFNLNYQ